MYCGTYVRTQMELFPTFPFSLEILYYFIKDMNLFDKTYNKLPKERKDRTSL